MKLREALDLIGPAVPPGAATWADLGAGKGVFTRAIASLLGPEGTVVAVDRDPWAAAALRALSGSVAEDSARIVGLEADYCNVTAIAAVAGDPIDGVVLANVLHFAAEPEPVISVIARWLRPGGRLVVVEYEGRRANRWVPYPVPIARLELLAHVTRLARPRVVGQRPSAYGGIMYCAVMERDQD